MHACKCLYGLTFLPALCLKLQSCTVQGFQHCKFLFLQGGAAHVLGFQKELNGVLRQLQQRDEQLQQKDTSLVRAFSCFAVFISLFWQLQQSSLL